MRTKSRRGMESLVGIMSTTDNAPAVVSTLKSDWSKRICGMVLLDATAEEVGQLYDGIPVGRPLMTSWTGFAGRPWMKFMWISPWTVGNPFCPIWKRWKAWGLTVHFRLKILDRIEEVCCDETSAARLYRQLGRCAGGNIVTMGTIEMQLRDQIFKRMMDIAVRWWAV